MNINTHYAFTVIPSFDNFMIDPLAISCITTNEHNNT